MKKILDAETRLQLLVKFGSVAVKERKLDNLLELTAEQVRLILNGDRCTVFLVDRETNEVWSKVAQGMEHTEIRIPMGVGIAGRVAQDGEIVNIRDAYADNRFTVDIDKVTGYKTRNILAVPLKNNKGEILGVFQVLNKLDGTHFDANDEGLLLLMGSLVSGAIENAELYEDIRRSQMETIYRLAVTAEYRDQHDTARHLRSMSVVSYYLAKALGIPEEEAENIKHASPLHDIGKVGLPDSILLKPGKLTEEEFEEMKKHTVFGGKILENAESHLLQLAYKISTCHHEKYNGKGYPQGLKGEEIPFEARIISVADVFDALSVPRVYKPAWDQQKAYEYIVSEAGQSFDPAVVEAFKKVYPLLKKLYDPDTPQETIQKLLSEGDN